MYVAAVKCAATRLKFLNSVGLTSAASVLLGCVWGVFPNKTLHHSGLCFGFGVFYSFEARSELGFCVLPLV